MPLATYRRVALFFAALLVVGATTACDECGATTGDDERPWRFVSDDADYELVFPGEWVLEPEGSINPHADVAASRDDTFFFMVIPQTLPSFPNPDVLELKRTALEMLDDSVDNLVVERQGPLELGGVSGLTVFTDGEVDGQSVAYITSYVIRNNMGYQIIAFTDQEHASKLFDETDAILSTWEFVDDEPADDDPSPETAAQ